MFYTRIPVPRRLEYTPEILNHSTRYFPVVGWIVGIISGGVFFASAMIFPVNISVAFSMAAGLLVTGAFHEDGLADFFDGFGGGWTKEKILEIMKDSRLGSYGGIALFMALLMKFLILSAVDKSVIPFLMITGHSLSRFTAASFVYTHNYARADETSKVKPIGKGITHAEFIFAAVTGLAPVLLLNNPLFFLLIFPLIPVKMIMGHYMQKWLEGYTGDCLGAVQQVSEIVIYLSYYAIWKFI
jgi:adenosylcobinamide-GDP ribazoletransferase